MWQWTIKFIVSILASSLSQTSNILIAELEKHIPDLHVLISTPFHPAYVTAERIKKAKNLELLLTAGIGSDHIDLKAAAAAGLTVAEVTGSNTVSVAEDELMRILILVRNFVPGYHQAISGEWNVAGIAYRSYDLEGKTIGTVGAGRIGKLLLQRLKPFNCNLLYHDRIRMDPELESQTGATYEEDLVKMLGKCDVVVINTPLTEKTKYVDGFIKLTFIDFSSWFSTRWIHWVNFETSIQRIVQQGVDCKDEKGSAYC